MCATFNAALGVDDSTTSELAAADVSSLIVPTDPAIVYMLAVCLRTYETSLRTCVSCFLVCLTA